MQPSKPKMTHFSKFKMLNILGAVVKTKDSDTKEKESSPRVNLKAAMIPVVSLIVSLFRILPILVYNFLRRNLI
jgi:uncharacterized protein YqhQ